MMNIILIEDEPPILRSLQGHIKKFQENFVVKGAFTNAKEALDFLEVNGQDIDVAITDIELPLINGLSFIEQIKNKFTHISYIIISGYDNFEYARTALRLGASNYLSKPVDTVELHKSLLTIYENKCMESMLASTTLESEHTVTDFSREYILAVVCDGNYSYFNPYLQSDTYDYEYHTQDLNSILQAQDTMEYKIAPGKSCYESIVFLHLGPNENETVTKRIHSFFTPLLKQETHFTIVISKVPGKLGDIASYLEKMRYCLYKSIIIGQTALIHYTPGKWQEPIFDLNAMNDRLYHLERIFVESNFPLFKQELWQFLSFLEENHYNQVTVFYYLNLLAYGCLVKQTKERPDILIPKLINDVVFYSQDYPSLYENLLSIFIDYLKDDSQSKGTMIEKIDYYIRQHYMEPINTSQLASAFNFTPSYLSKMFREYKNISPIEYIIALKIERAQELLLQNPDLPIKDCAALIGYHDPLYFSKVFKKVTGLSPKQFICNTIAANSQNK